MELNPEVDLIINVTNLGAEFRNFSTTFYRYSESRAATDEKRDIAKAKLKEIRGLAYKRIKSDPSVKHTEKSLEAEIDTDPQVLDAQQKLIEAERNAASVSGAVESMRHKKDCLIQLGADSRKERQ